MLTAFGEPEIQSFVRASICGLPLRASLCGFPLRASLCGPPFAASIDEALKLERGLSQLRAEKRVVVLHYSPIAATVQQEPPEISTFMGTSRLVEAIDRQPLYPPFFVST